jgi:hypothetical protein
MKRPLRSVTVKTRFTSLAWTLMVVMGSLLAGVVPAAGAVPGAGAGGADCCAGWVAGVWAGDFWGAEVWGAEVWGAEVWGAEVWGAEVWGAEVWGTGASGGGSLLWAWRVAALRRKLRTVEAAARRAAERVETETVTG